MISSFRKLYAAPTAHELAVRELDEAKRTLLGAQTRLDFAHAEVRFNEDRIRRLEAYVRNAAVQQ